MWAIAQSVVIHNIKLSGFWGLMLCFAFGIYTLIDPFTPADELERGSLTATFFALIGAVITLLFVVLNELPKEISSKSHLLILSKPITRMDYFLGKIIGVFLFASISLALLVAFAYVSLVYHCEHQVPLLQNCIFPFFHYLLFLWMVSLLAGIIGVFLSEAMCIMISFFLLIGSYAIGLVPVLLEKELSLSAGIFLKGIYFFFPNFQYYELSEYEHYGWFSFFLLGIYSLGYTGIALPISLKYFEKKSFY